MANKICPKCKKRNTTAIGTDLNYCMYGCGHAFNDVMGYFTQKVEQPKIKPSGQVLLFGTNFLMEG